MRGQRRLALVGVGDAGGELIEPSVSLGGVGNELAALFGELGGLGESGAALGPGAGGGFDGLSGGSLPAFEGGGGFLLRLQHTVLTKPVALAIADGEETLDRQKLNGLGGLLTLGGDALLLQSFLLLAKSSSLLSDFDEPALGAAKLRGERLHVARAEGFENFALRAGLLPLAADGLFQGAGFTFAVAEFGEQFGQCDKSNRAAGGLDFT